jgi:hypothetical protein
MKSAVRVWNLAFAQNVVKNSTIPKAANSAVVAAGLPAVLKEVI